MSKSFDKLGTSMGEYSLNCGRHRPLCSAMPRPGCEVAPRRASFSPQCSPGALVHRVANRYGDFGWFRGETRNHSKAENGAPPLSVTLSIQTAQRWTYPLPSIAGEETQTQKGQLAGLFVLFAKENPPGFLSRALLPARWPLQAGRAHLRSIIHMASYEKRREFLGQR